MTQKDLAAQLQELVEQGNSPVSGVQFEFPPAVDGVLRKIGPAGDGQETEKSSLDLSASSPGSVLIWRRSNEQALRRQVTEGLVELGKAAFGAVWRDEKSSLVSTHVTGVRSLVERALQRMVEAHGAASVIYADLDHFKLVNDEESHEAGNIVIREVAEMLELSASPDALAVHDGGDEFLLICPGHVERGLELGRRVADAFARHEFSTKIDINITMGLRPVPDGYALPSLETLAREAEDATKELGEGGEHDGPKRRGRISVFTNLCRPEIELELGSQLDRAVVVVKSLVGHPRPFEDAWLNVVSQRAVETLQTEGIQALAKRMTELTDWIAPSWSAGCAAAARLAPTEEIPTWSRVDFCMAVAHGLLRAVLLSPEGIVDPAGRELTIHYTNGESALLELGDDVLVDCGGGDEAHGLGGFIVPEGDISDEALDTRIAVLVNIGDQLPEALSPVFYETITVDDRPTSGGGLPDFWEATVARIVAAASRSPNVDFLAVVGASEHGAYTIEQLNDIGEWDADRAWELADRTASDPRDIASAGKQLKDSYHVCSDPEEVLTLLAQHLIPERRLKPVSEPPDAPGPIVISREWTATDLDKRDGFRAKTVSEAFPLVLQVLGQALERDDFQIVDGAGIRMVDLRDVKILFEEPFQESIPAFYRNRSDSFNTYFDKHFVNPDGKFANAITGEQYERVITHVVHAITRTEPFSTRRANIVLPHDLSLREPPDLSPLGLTSLRCIPRFSDREILLHFSFTWRTVEALVGFPYSAYGSVRYAKRMFEDIRHRVTEQGRPDLADRLRVADISYIAHSLHMATDAYGRKIAHRIIAGQ
jgi:diguanylate cyclase (GGDEF)-like protein